MAIIEGTADSDSLSGGDADDQIYGFAGNDTLDGGLGDDRLYGGAGDDLIRTGQGNDIAWGASGNDTLRGDDLPHTLYGGTGDDWVLLGVDDFFFSTPDPVRYRNVAFGGDGNDLLQAWGHFNARLSGGDGVDTAKLLYYSDGLVSMVVRVDGPGAGMTASDGQRVTFESIERLEFYADVGAHEVHGGDLDDLIFVGAGSDWVDAGLGNDHVQYRPDTAHYLDGGAGEDLLTLEGIWRQSVYFVVGGSGQVDDGMLSTIRNFETYHVFGQGRADDFIALGQGNDTGEGFAGNDSLYGGGGDDSLLGGGGDDGMGGGDGADTMAGGSGDDMIGGDSGNDRVSGATGNDTLYGGNGDDTLKGGLGDDWLSGGDGNDRFVFGLGDGGGDLVVDFTSGADQLRFAAELLAMAPGWTGRATAADFAVGAATAAQGQFVVVYNSVANLTELVWDADGTAGTGSEQTLVYLSGIVTVAAEDLWIV